MTQLYKEEMWGEMLCYQSGTICQCVLYEEQTLTGPAGQRHRAQVINMPRLMSSPSFAFASQTLSVYVHPGSDSLNHC